MVGARFYLYHVAQPLPVVKKKSETAPLSTLPCPFPIRCLHNMRNMRNTRNTQPLSMSLKEIERGPDSQL